MTRGCLMVAILACLATSLPAGAAEAASLGRPGCLATNNAEHAARRLLDPAATVVSLDDASALLSVPLVVTGARHRLLRTSDGWWCDGLAGYNAVAAGRDGLVTATGFASVAAARYFDRVEVRSARVTSPGRVQLQTHARTNGVVADWTVHVDASGVRKATWTATAFAVAPFDAELYGPTALPGATMSYQRLSDGRLTAVRDPFLETGDHPPVETSVVDTSDGFRIIVSRGHAPYVYPDVRTGQYDVDSLGMAVRSTRSNYEDFLSWGMRGSWTGPGHVFVDGGLTAVCMACVQAGPVFNVHIFSRMADYAARLGYSYPDPELMFSSVMGHEIFHNFQVSYGGIGLPVAFVEGTARFQETLHDYSHVNHQPGSIVYAGGTSGCNGYLDDMGAAISEHWYDACLFWFSFYADQGLPGLLRLLDASGTARTLEQAVEEATNEPLAETASRFASRILTRQPLAWGPATGNGPVLDWSAYLWGWWSAEPLRSGRMSALGRGGVMAAALPATTTISLTASNPGVVFRVVRRTSTGFDTEPAQDGITVPGPGPGESVWITAASGVDTDVTFAPVGADPSDPGDLSWSRLEPRTYRYWNPLGRADASASGDLATLGFHLDSFAEDPVAMPTLSTSARATAELSGTMSVEAGLHNVILRIRLDEVSLTTTRSVPSAHISTANGYGAMSLSCADMSPGCSAYDSIDFSQSSGAQPGVVTVTLSALIDVPTAQTLRVTTTFTAESSGRGGSAKATLAGQVIESEVVKL